MGAAPPLHFVVPVWGESYVQTFLDYCLPAQLSPDNIPALGGASGNSYTIHTTRSDHERMAESPSFRALQKLIAVTVEFLDVEQPPAHDTPAGDKYRVKSDCYRIALQRATARRAAVVALNADILLANGFVRTAVDLLSRGKRVIEVPGPRGLRDPIGRTLISRYRGADGTSITIEPTELSALWVRNMHPQLEMHYVEGPEGAPFHPSHLYWTVGNEGVIIRGFHLYPIVIVPRDSAIGFSTTIDDDLVGSLKLSKGEAFLAQDSRDMFCCELSPPDHYVGHMASRGDLSRYVDFYLTYARQNIRNLQQEIIISGVRDLSSRWNVRRKQSATFTTHLLKRYRAEVRRRYLKALRQRIAEVFLLPLRTIRNLVVRVLRRIVPEPLKGVLRRARAAFSNGWKSKDHS
jgi:hypothetical protein